jgi:hypothetical protein
MSDIHARKGHPADVPGRAAGGEVVRWLRQPGGNEEAVRRWLLRAEPPAATPLREEATPQAEAPSRQWAELAETLADLRSQLEGHGQLPEALFPEWPSGPLPQSPETPVMHLYLDADRDGKVDADHRGLATWEWGRGKKGAIILVNNDADATAGRKDNEDDVVGANDSDELAPLVIRRLRPATVPAGWQVELLVDDKDNIRIFDGRGAGRREIIGPTAGPVYRFTDLTPDRFEFGMEALRYAGMWTGIGTFKGEVKITLRLTHPLAARTEETAVVRVAPWMMAHHLDRATTVFVVDLRPANAAFHTKLEGLVKAAGCTLIASAPYRNALGEIDPWVQDCMVLGYSNLPKHGIQVVIPSPQPVATRALRPFPKTLLARDVGYEEIGSLTVSSDFDGGGNLEVSPPVTLKSGKRYPWGRIYYGPGRSFGTAAEQAIDPDLKAFLNAQVVQKPFEVDTAWLAVGHVDEIISFVPAPGSPGFKLLLASPRYAYEILDRLKVKHGTAKLLVGRQIEGDTVEVSVNDFLANMVHIRLRQGLTTTTPSGTTTKTLRSFNDDKQVALDKTKRTLEVELGLDTGDIIEVPVVFMPLPLVTTGAIALTGNMVNMLVVNGHCIVPKPFGPEVGGVDRFWQELVTKLRPLGLQVDPIDTWEPYHAAVGEVHCATDTMRKANLPRWWEFKP